MSDNPDHWFDRADAERHLRWLHPAGPWTLTAIPPARGNTATRTFIDLRAALGWAERQNRYLGVYVSVARLRGSVDKKASKADVESVGALWVDVDPPKGMEPADMEVWRAGVVMQAQAFKPEPSCIASSGGGVHAYWRLDQAADGSDASAMALVEACNRALAKALGGDKACVNVDRILRLWGSRNMKPGREPGVARVLFEGDAIHPISAFPGIDIASSSPAAVGQLAVTLPLDLPTVDVEALPVSPRVRMLIVQGDDPNEPERYPSRSEVSWAVTCAMVKAACEDPIIAAVLLDPNFAISAHTLAQRRPREYVERQIGKAREQVGTKRPRIVYDENELPRVLDEAEAALLASDVQLYQMNGRLVQPVALEAAGSDEEQVRRDAGALIIHDLNEHRLLEHMIAAADFVKVSRSAKGELTQRPCAPPLKFAKHYAHRVGAWRLPVLEGISTIPTMRADGTIVSADGYDRDSRLIINTQGVVFPPVQDRPTREDALAALEALVDPISEFPFVQDDEDGEPSGQVPSASRSAALSMLLTAVSRHAISSAPIYGLSAPTMETGKSLLADVPAMMVTGRRATKMSQGASEEEDEKRLLSVLMRGDPVNVIDNIAREVSGDALCTIITEETWSGRWLGQSRMVEVSTKALFVATGNNLIFREDMAVRAVMVSLDAGMERPGERPFTRDLREYLPRQRATLVVAALTVLRAYVVAGKPKPPGMKPSRFTDWSDLIRGALVWLGEPDPLDTQARVTAGDNARAELLAVMAALRDAFGAGAFVSPSEIIARAADGDRADQRPGALGLALSGACSGRSGVSAVGLGKFLKSKAGRRHDGMWIKARLSDKSGNRYAVMVEEPTQAQWSML